MIATRIVRLLAACFLALALPVLAAPITVHEEAELFMNSPAAKAGSAVSISGDTAVVGAPHANSDTGQVDVYVRTPGTSTWTHQATLTAGAPAAGVAGDLFGASVSVSGNNIAVGAAARNSGIGAAYTFNRSGTTWTQSQVLTPSAVADVSPKTFGNSVAIEGLTVVVGAPRTTVHGKSEVGSAYVFVSLNGGTTWFQQSALQIVTGQAKAGDHIGWGVALSGNTALAGAPDDDFGNKTSAGSVYVFVRNGARWTKQARLNPGPTANYRVGASVALNANTAVFGADIANSNQGKAFVYTRTGTSWSLKTTLTASDAANGDHFGAASAVSGSLIVVGAPQASNSSLACAGQIGKAYVFDVVGGVYTEVDHLVANDCATGDQFGAGVSADSGRVLVGAPQATEDTNANNGSSYVFLVKQASVTTITSIVPEPSYAGQDYVVHFTVNHVTGGVGVPTGTVTVSDGNGGGCVDVALVAGAGTCTLNSDTAGSLTISAAYSGDLLFGASGTTKTHNVSAVNTITTLALNPSPSSVVGQTVTATVSVTANPPSGVTLSPSAPAPVGNVTVSDGVVGHPTCTVDLGVGTTCQLVFTAVGGPFNYTASYAPYPDAVGYGYNPSTSSPAVPHSVTKASTTVTVTSNTPTVFGQNAALTATVHVTAPGGGTPTGTMTFFDGVTTLGTAALNGSGVATFNTTTLSVGAHSIKASYGGDANYNASPLSAAFTHTVNKAATTTNLSQDIQPSTVGQTVTFTSHVLVTAPGSGTPAGSITVSNGTQSCSILLPAISCTIAFSTAGTHNVTATYGGDGNFNGSASASLSHTTNPAAANITISQIANPSQVNDVVTIFVKISGLGVTPTGSVAITAPGTAGCSIAALSVNGNGSCQLTFTSPGTVTVHAAYSGDANYSAGGADQSHTTAAPSGYHLAFDTGPTNILVGQRLSTVVVSIRQDATGTPGTLKSADSTTQVTLSLTTQPCGDPVFFGPVTVNGGIATFTLLGPIFYNTYTGLTVRADDSIPDTHATSGTFNVTSPNSELVFSNGFDLCRL